MFYDIDTCSFGRKSLLRRDESSLESHLHQAKHVRCQRNLVSLKIIEIIGEILMKRFMNNSRSNINNTIFIKTRWLS
jgi:hypothetical protein